MISYISMRIEIYIFKSPPSGACIFVMILNAWIGHCYYLFVQFVERILGRRIQINEWIWIHHPRILHVWHGYISLWYGSIRVPMWEYMLGPLRGSLIRWKLRKEVWSKSHVWVSHAVGTPQVPPSVGPPPGSKDPGENSKPSCGRDPRMGGINQGGDTRHVTPLTRNKTKPSMTKLNVWWNICHRPFQPT